MLYRLEAGACGKNLQCANAILVQIRQARHAVASQRYPSASHRVLLGYYLLFEAIAETPWYWRALHLFALDLVVFYASVFAALVWYGVSGFDYQILGVSAAAAFFGTLGGLLRGLWGLTVKVQRRDFRPQFRPVYYCAPITAAVMGTVAVVLADVLPVDLGAGAGTDLPSSTTVACNEPLASLEIAIAVLAGFSWEWLTGKLEQLTSS